MYYKNKPEALITLNQADIIYKYYDFKHTFIIENTKTKELKIKSIQAQLTMPLAITFVPNITENIISPEMQNWLIIDR